MDFRRQPGSRRQLYIDRGQGSASHHGLVRQQRGHLQTVGYHQLRLSLTLPLSSALLASGLIGLGRVPELPPPTIRQLAPGVYAAIGDTGLGSEGRPNAGFVVTRAGVVVIDALASPQQGQQLLSAIRRVTSEPVAWLVLTHHHPDHHFGAIVFRRLGAKVIAHPDRRVLASEAGEDALTADWVRVVGLDAMRGFAFADTPDRPVTGVDTLRLGERT